MTGIIPKTIAAGVSFSAAVQLPAFAKDWDALLYLRGPAAIDLEAVVSGYSAEFTAAAADTADWAPGDYAWTIRVTNGGDVAEVACGRMTIRPDLASLPAGADSRTENQVALDAIKAVLSSRASKDQDRYRINNRELYRTSIPDLLKLKAHYQQLVNNECCDGTVRRGRIGSIRVGFGPIRG